MRATTNWGNLTLPAPAGGVKSGKPVRMSDALAIVPQSDFAEGEPMSLMDNGVEIAVEVAAAIPQPYTAVRINADGVVSAGAPAAGFAKLGVTKYASKQLTRKHTVTQAESDAVGGPYEDDVVGSVVDETYNAVKVIVQGI